MTHYWYTGTTIWLRWAVRLGCATGGLIIASAVSNGHAAESPIELKIVGGLGGISQYEEFEKPFWIHDVPQLTGGRVKAEIHPFDQSGLAGREMLQLMRLGVVPYGTALLAQVAGDEPELNAVDLPTLNPDMASLRRTVGLYRNHLREVLQRKYGITLLAIYTYPAQVLFCTEGFDTLKDLAGRRVRTSSVGQSEMMSSLGAIPVMTPFSDIVSAIKRNVVDCAITGTMSGNEIGLPEVTSYISPMAINWGLSFFGVNTSAWEELPQDIREILAKGIGKLELSIWDAADRQTASGIACDIGASGCVGGKIFPMHLAKVTPNDDAQRKQFLTDSILPKWIERCGGDCVTTWNEIMAPTLGVRAAGE